jgi:hypothetical protein
MRIFVDDKVDAAIDDFYDAALRLHWNTLSEETVMHRKDKLYDGIRILGNEHVIFSKARLKKEWIDSGWYEYICEGFHFAYELCKDENGEPYVWVHDAEHSLLYR